MTGADQIIACRKRGIRPTWVTLMLGCGKAQTVGDVTLTESDRRPDLRFLVGLDVVLVTPTWTQQAFELWQRIKDAAPDFAIAAVLSWGDDVGLMWKPGQGEREFGSGWH